MFADDPLLIARADQNSMQLLFDVYFTKFSSTLSVEANLDKINVYIGGVNDITRQTQQQIVNIPVGNFPFKYFGVPLTTRKLFYHEFKPLIEKTSARVRL